MCIRDRCITYSNTSEFCIPNSSSWCEIDEQPVTLFKSCSLTSIDTISFVFDWFSKFFDKTIFRRKQCNFVYRCNLCLQFTAHELTLIKMCTYFYQLNKKATKHYNKI